MTKTVFRSGFGRTVRAVDSKSELIRIMILAAFSDSPLFIPCAEPCGDVKAAADCLAALGAKTERTEKGYAVTPVSELPTTAVLPCRESASVLRFLLPLTAAAGVNARFLPGESLAKRPIAPLTGLLSEKGARISTDENGITTSGTADLTLCEIAGNVSSQFISGLMFACAFSGGGEIRLSGRTESRPYILLTARMMEKFGITAEVTEDRVLIRAERPFSSPGVLAPSGDWSDSAFALTAGVIGGAPVTVTGLDNESAQGDKAIVPILCAAGAKIVSGTEGFTAYPSALTGFRADLSDIPDLAPVLAVAAANAEGKSVLTGVGRLRFKESDRVESIRRLITSLGGECTVTENEMTVSGGGLRGGFVDPDGDHRIVLAAVTAAAATKEPVVIKDYETAAKSHPLTAGTEREIV